LAIAESQRQFASQIPGPVTVEAVDLKDLVAFAEKFDITAGDALHHLAQFAQSVMTNVGALTQGTARKEATDVERAALAFVRTPTHRGAVEVLAENKAVSDRTDRRSSGPVSTL
jgi:hypothetical protein